MTRLATTALIGSLLLGTTTAHAQGANDGAGGWAYELKLYLWGTEVGTTVRGEDVTIGFDELIENLNGAIMGGLRAYRDEWMLYGELSHADVGQSGDTSFTISPGPGPGVDIDAVAEADVQTTIASFGAGYRLIDDPNYAMYATFGVRYLKLAVQADVDIGNRSFEIEEDNNVWDATVGLAGEATLNETWFVPWILDIGAGESDFTWQAGVGLGYRFDRSDIVLGYRHMEWDLPDNDAVSRYYQSGPLLLWNYRF